MIDPQLTGRTVLVTGGAANIGAAVTRAFAAQGARVAVHYLPRDAPAPDGVSWEHLTPAADHAESFAQTTDGAAAFGADLTEDGAITGLLDRVEASLGPVDVLINNAAHVEHPDRVLSLTAETMRRTYAVNTVVPTLLLAEIARRHPGRPFVVVSISTDAARAFAGQIAYGSSKAALEAITRAAALELGPTGVRINVVAPGPVQTGWMSDELVERVLPDIPLGRVGEPADIADACVFLASHQARWITGQVLQVAGGHAL